MNLKKIFPTILFSLLLSSASTSNLAQASNPMRDYAMAHIEEQLGMAEQRAIAYSQQRSVEKAYDHLLNRPVILKSISSGCYLDGRHTTGIEVLVTNRNPQGDNYLQWRIERVDGNYALKSISSGGYLDGRDDKIGGKSLIAGLVAIVKNPELMIKAALVTNRNPQGDDFLQWRIELVDGNYALKSISKGGYLDGRSDPGAVALVTNRNPQGDNFLQWTINPIN